MPAGAPPAAPSISPRSDTGQSLVEEDDDEDEEDSSSSFLANYRILA